MTDDVMMQIGEYPFSVNTAAYSTFKRSTSYRWAEQGRLGRKPAKQYIGPESETVKLAGMILPAYRGGTGQIDDMRAEADLGEPLILVDGLGNVWGRWVIEKITEAQSHLTSYGVGRKVMFEMEISEYGEDQLLPISAQQAAAFI